MIPSKFKYHRANSVDEAISLLSDLGDEAQLLAGGHSLIPSMKLRLSEPEALIDIGRIKELRFINEEGNELVIGAGCTHNDIATSSLVADHMPMMAQAGAMIGDPHVRNKGTIGGSLAHADPAADWPALMLAAEAAVVVRGPGGERRINAEDFFQGLFMTALEDNEIITAVRVPKSPGDTHSAYMKFPHPASRYAIVGCAVMLTMNGVTCERARVAFTGASSKAFRDKRVEDALSGQALSTSNINAASEIAAAGVHIMSDNFASEKYRRNLARVYAKKTIRAAAGL